MIYALLLLSVTINIIQFNKYRKQDEQIRQGKKISYEHIKKN